MSNWNNQREFNAKLNQYYSGIHDEMKTILLNTKQNLKTHDSLAKRLNNVLDILQKKDKSKISELKNNLGALATAWSVTISATVFDEFINQELLSKVKDKELKGLLSDVKNKSKRLDMMSDYSMKQYNILLEPYIANSINYSTIALPRYKKYLKQGGPETDFTKLFESVEFWNRVTFKLETTNLAISELNLMVKAIEKLQEKLESLDLENYD